MSLAKLYFRLEEAGGGEFRQGSITVDTDQIEGSAEKYARALLEQKENGYAAYRLTVDELAEHEQIEATAIAEAQEAEGLAVEAAAGSLAVVAPVRPSIPADTRSKLALHRQAEPYKIVYLGPKPYLPKSAKKDGKKGGDE